MSTLRRLAVMLAIGALVVLAAPAAADAHSQLQHTNPADGATVTAPIAELTLTFNERVHGNFTTVVVTGPRGLNYSNGHVQVIDDDVHQKLFPLHSGGYRVAWRAISADGHPVEGEFGFTVALPRDQEPTGFPAAATVAEPASHTWWWLLAGAAVVLLAGGFAATRMRRRR